MDFGNEVFDLAFHPDQPRGRDGRWISTGMGSGGAHAAPSGHVHSGAGVVHMPEHFSPPPDDFMERQRATRRQLVAASQRRILDALTMSPDLMNDEQIVRASRVIENLTPHDYEEIRSKAKKVVPAHIADHVNDELAKGFKALQNEDNHDAKRVLIGHLALIIGALAVSFITAGLGAPAAVAALAGLTLPILNEFHDYTLNHKKEPLVNRKPVSKPVVKA